MLHSKILMYVFMAGVMGPLIFKLLSFTCIKSPKSESQIIAMVESRYDVHDNV